MITELLEKFEDLFKAKSREDITKIHKIELERIGWSDIYPAFKEFENQGMPIGKFEKYGKSLVVRILTDGFGKMRFIKDTLDDYGFKLGKNSLYIESNSFYFLYVQRKK